MKSRVILFVACLTAFTAWAGSVDNSRTGNPVGVTGTATANDCVKFADSFGNLADTGSPCAGGSGTVTSVGVSSTGSTVTVTGSPVTTSGTINVEVAALPAAVPAAGSVVSTNIAAPSSPAAGKDAIYTDSTDLRLHDKNASGVIGTTVVADTGAANNYISAISAAGAISKSRPACATLSDSGTSCTVNTGTSGATIPLLNGANTYSGASTFSAAVTDSVNGAASTPPLFFTGTILTGGSGTTNFPNLFLQPTGTTAATTWSTSGTGLGMNLASGFAGNFIDFKVNGGGSSLFVVSSSGAVTAGASLGFKTVLQNASLAHIIMSVTAPSIASGFGTSPSLVANNGTAAFKINVGTGGSASSGVVTMPAAATDWLCAVSPTGAPQAGAEMFSAPTSSTSITITNYTASTGVALAWPASTVIGITCVGE